MFNELGQMGRTRGKVGGGYEGSITYPEIWGGGGIKKGEDESLRMGG